MSLINEIQSFQSYLYKKISKHMLYQIESISRSILLEKLLNQKSSSHQPLLLQYHQQYTLQKELYEEQDTSAIYAIIDNKSFEYIKFLIECEEIDTLSQTSIEELFNRDPDKDQYYGWYDATKLIVATVKGKYDIVKFLLDKGANINISDSYALTPLHHAVLNNDINLIKLLLKYKPNFTINDKYARSIPILHTAINTNNIDIVKLLINAGVDLETRSIIYWNNTVLIQASRNSASIDIIKYLLVNGAMVNAKNENNETAIHIELFNTYYYNSKRVNCIKLLLDYGADINFEYNYNDNYKNVIDFAKSKNLKEIKECFENYYKKIQTNLYIKISKQLTSNVESISLSILLEKFLKNEYRHQPIQIQYHQQFNLLTELKEKQQFL